ncbi:MAG TPA: polysaccharide deacetylase family protein [Mucilaginibacter sp.]
MKIAIKFPVKNFIVLAAVCLQAVAANCQPGKTEITRWQFGKNGAVSLTYDDGSINQFTYALPIMERLRLPATFFVITGGIPDSKYHGKFIGRPVKTIIRESATIPTNETNFLERCSAGGYLGYKGTITYVTRAASAYDNPKRRDRAYKIMDTLYQKVRAGDFQPGYQPCDEVLQEEGLTWSDLKGYSSRGYEIASHSITHASMPGLDSVNIRYELEKSKEEIRDKMGERATFSTEVPYGYENERVMKIAYKIYPALRNRMPEPWLKEIDRASRETPGNTTKDYIQWQRGATTKTPLPLMEQWVDTAVEKGNTWLVLVFHGVDGLGYEALPHTMLDDYFQYIKAHQDKLWIATFGDVTKYMREREKAKVETGEKAGKITINLTQSLDKAMYDVPLTLKTYVSAEWSRVWVWQGKRMQRVDTEKDGKGTYVLYQAYPNTVEVMLSGKEN